MSIEAICKDPSLDELFEDMEECAELNGRLSNFIPYQNRSAPKRFDRWYENIINDIPEEEMG